jgi:hypothetical protein
MNFKQLPPDRIATWESPVSLLYRIGVRPRNHTFGPHLPVSPSEGEVEEVAPNAVRPVAQTKDKRKAPLCAGLISFDINGLLQAGHHLIQNFP